MRLPHTVTKKGSCVCDAWLVWCGACGRACEAAERSPRRDHFVANCSRTDHKPRGGRARKDYGKMILNITQ